MQVYYGDEPHVIQKSRARRKKSGTPRKKRTGAILAFTLFLSAVLLLLAAVLPESGIACKAKSWYFVCLYNPTEIVEAEVSAELVKESGGAGYVLNDGAFNVAAAVYASKHDAESVANKSSIPAFVYLLKIKAVKLPSTADKDTDKTVREGFDCYKSVFSSLTASVEKFERGESTESGLLQSLGSVRVSLLSWRERITAAYNATNRAEIGALVGYFDAMVAALDSAVTGENEGLASRVRYAICEIVHRRSVLSGAIG